MENFIITYNLSIKKEDGTVESLNGKVIRVKNKQNEFFALVSLEDYLKKKYGNGFVAMSVVKCDKDCGLSDFYDLLFGSNNPFTKM